MQRFLIDIVFQEKGLNDNIHNIVEKHFRISIANPQSRGGSQDSYKHECSIILTYQTFVIPCYPQIISLT
jgi:hypothetical protein